MSISARLASLEGGVRKRMQDSNISRTNALAGLDDEQIRDIDALLGIARLILHRRDASHRSKRILEEIVDIIERAAAETEHTEYRSDVLLAEAESAVERLRDAHARSMPHASRV